MFNVRSASFYRQLFADSVDAFVENSFKR